MSLEPPSWSPTELDVMRIGLGLVVIKTFSGIQTFRPSGEPSFPVGIARFANLSWLASRSAARWLQHGAYIAALCFAADLLVPFVLLFLAAAAILEETFRSSYGAVNHGHHLLVIVLTAQAAATVVWNAAVQWHWDLGPLLAESQQETAVWWAIQAIAAVYFTSGLSKVLNSGGHWIRRSPALLLDAYGRIDTDEMMRKGKPRRSDRLISWLFDRPALTQWVFAAGLLVELTTPIGLLAKLLLFAAGVALIALHKGNRTLLGLPFPEYQLIVFIYLVNLPQFID
jgi:hypothetical protein